MSKQQHLTAAEKRQIATDVIGQITAQYNLPPNWLSSEIQFIEGTASRKFADQEPEFRRQVGQQLLEQLRKINPVMAQAFEMELKFYDGGAVDGKIFRHAPAPKDNQQFNEFLSGNVEAISLAGKALGEWIRKNGDKLSESGISYSIDGETIILRNENYIPASLEGDKKALLVSRLQESPTQATIDAIAAYVVASRELESSSVSPEEKQFLEIQQQEIYRDIEAGKPRLAKQRAIAMSYYLGLAARARDYGTEAVQGYLKMSRNYMEKSRLLSAVASLNLAGTSLAVSAGAQEGTLGQYLEKAQEYVAKGKLEKASRINRLVLQHLQLSQLSISFGDISAEDLERVAVSLTGFSIFQEEGKFSEKKFLEITGMTYEEFKKKGLSGVLQAFYEKGRVYASFAKAKITEALDLEVSGKNSNKMQDEIMLAFQKTSQIITEGTGLAGIIQSIRRVRAAAVELGRVGFEGVTGLKARYFLEERRKDAIGFYQRIEGHFMQAFFYRVAAIEEPPLRKTASRFEQAIFSLQRKAAAKTNEIFKYYNISANFESYVKARAEASKRFISESSAILKKMRAQFSDLEQKTRGNITATGCARTGKEEMDDYVLLVEAQYDSVKIASGIIASYSPDEVEIHKAGGTLEGMFGKKNPGTSAFDAIDNQVGMLGAKAQSYYKLTLRDIENALTDMPIQGVWYDPVTLAAGGFGVRGVIGLGQVAWRALPSAVQFGLSAGATAYGTMELGQGSYAYISADTEEQEKKALEHLRSGAITLGMGIIGLSSMRMLSPVFVTSTEAGTVGAGIFVTREDVARMSRTGKIEPLILATDVLMFLPAIPLAAKAASAARKLPAESQNLVSLIEKTIGTAEGPEALNSPVIRHFLSRSYQEQERILSGLLSIGRASAAQRLSYLRGVSELSHTSLITEETASQLSIAILQERNIRSTSSRVFSLIQKLETEGIVANFTMNLGSIDVLGALSSNVSRLVSEGRLVFGGRKIPAGSQIRVFDYKKGVQGAFIVTAETRAGERVSFILKLQNLSAEKFGAELVMEAGIAAPQVVTRVGGRQLAMVGAEGYQEYGLMQHMANFSGTLPRARTTITFQARSATSMKDLDEFIAQNPIFRSLLETDPLAARKLIFRRFGFSQTGVMNVGLYDSHRQNMFSMLGEISRADAGKLLASRNYLLFEEGVTASGSLTPKFAGNVEGIVMKAKDGRYYIYEVGRIDTDTGACFLARMKPDGLSFNAMMSEYAGTIGPSVRIIDSALNNAGAVSRSYTFSEAAADMFAGAQTWYRSVGRDPAFRTNVARRIAAYDGQPIGIGTGIRFPEGFLARLRRYAPTGKLSAGDMETMKRYFLEGQGQSAFDKYLAEVHQMPKPSPAAREGQWTALMSLIRMESVNGSTVVTIFPDGRAALNAKEAIDAFNELWGLTTSTKLPGQEIWRQIFRRAEHIH
ncbi:hypothetical protein JXA56_00945 [Candidatus Micrarchaeota archaeon]|nr:hypothetical protein [Candidatus Micrarchaeota archaeon]